MNKKGILITILVSQLILLVLFSLVTIHSERNKYIGIQEFNKLASYRIAALSENLESDVSYLKIIGADSKTFDDFVRYVNGTYRSYYSCNMSFDGHSIYISDNTFNFYKEKNI